MAYINGKKVLQVVITSGSGEGVTIPQVSNIAVDEYGYLTFTAGDYTYLQQYDPIISYIVTINNTATFETTATTYNIFAYLVEGNNTISITTKAILTMNSDPRTKTIEYSAPSEPIGIVTTLNAKLPRALQGCVSAIVDDDVYIIGGENSSRSGVNTIYKYDTLSDTITTLSVTLPTTRYGMCGSLVGKKVYLFGGISASAITSMIQIFDTEAKTITNASATLPLPIKNMKCEAVGTKIYLFGGEDTNGTYLNTIYIYDTTTDVITTASATLLNATEEMASAVIGTKIYLFGGKVQSAITKYNTISIYDTTTDTITTASATITSYGISGSCAKAIGNKIYIFGGQSNTMTNYVYCYTTTADTITTLSNRLPRSEQGMTCEVKDLKIYLFGGATSTSGSSFHSYIDLFY